MLNSTKKEIKDLSDSMDEECSFLVENENVPPDQIAIDGLVDDERMVKLQELYEEEFNREYDKKSLYWVFFLMFNCTILVNIDHGALPS